MQIRTARGLGRLIGLAFRADFADALHLPRCRSVHTFGMRFALDLVWLDAAGKVVRIDRGVPPCRVRSCRAARSVLEMRASSGQGDRGDAGDDDDRARDPQRRDALARRQRRGRRGHDDAGLA
jgi:uncharacterized membrane protein (UPF0127 family)